MPNFSSDITTAINQDNRQTFAASSGGLAQILEDMKDDIGSGPIGIGATAGQIDAVAGAANAFQQNTDTTTGLVFGFKAATFFNFLSLVVVNAGTITLAASTTNYVEVNAAGVVSSNTTAFTSGSLPLWTINTGVGTISGITPVAPVRYLFGLAGVTGSLLSSAGKTKELVIPLGTISATAIFLIPTPGFACHIAKAALVVGTTVATDDTNYWTVDLMNKGPAGTGTTATLAATDANTTKTTGGAALTANVARALSLHGTSGNLDTAADDVLKLTLTKAASGANLVNAALRLDFSFTG